MASVQVRVAFRFPPGTTVGAYPRSQFAMEEAPNAAPPGAADASAAVGADGALTFTGLAARSRYFAYAQVSGAHRYVQFSTFAAEDEPSVWSYEAGASGSVAIPTNATVLSCSAFSAAGGSITLGNRDVIPLPGGVSFQVAPVRLVGAETFLFDSTDAFCVDYLP